MTSIKKTRTIPRRTIASGKPSQGGDNPRPKSQISIPLRTYLPAVLNPPRFQGVFDGADDGLVSFPGFGTSCPALYLARKNDAAHDQDPSAVSFIAPERRSISYHKAKTPRPNGTLLI